MDQEGKRMLEEIKESFRKFAENNGLPTEDAEKFAAEVTEVIKEGPRFKTAQAMYKAVRKVTKKYGLPDIPKNKRAGN